MARADVRKRLKRGVRRNATLSVAIAALAVSSCNTVAAGCVANAAFGYDQPERMGINLQILLELTEWLNKNPTPILSLTLSRNGKVVFELYTSNVDRNSAHYLMSVTKSVTSALFGIAIDRKLIKTTDSTVADNLPKTTFPDEVSYNRFKKVSIKDILGMSALDAQLTPHVKTVEAKARSHNFFRAGDRLKFALEQPTLPRVGNDFQYTDVTPIIAAGIVQLATGKTLLDFGKQALFDPMGFENEEWMHQDRAGYDNASYGLRLRPVDMQKFGVLFLNQGCWNGQQLISREWVATSFTPWIKSNSRNHVVNYGWYWWTDRFPLGWIGYTANGWKGQRITVVPDKGIVVTMTGIIEDDTSDIFYRDIVSRFIIPAVETPVRPGTAIAELKSSLAANLQRIRVNKNAFGPNTERRMLPSIAPKEAHKEFRPPRG